MKVVVLNDGTTYTNVKGCRVVDVPDNVADDDRVEEWLERNPDVGTDVGAILSYTKSLYEALQGLTREVHIIKTRLRIDHG